MFQLVFTRIKYRKYRENPFKFNSLCSTSIRMYWAYITVGKAACFRINYVYLCSLLTKVYMSEQESKQNDYGAKNITALEGLEAVRRRPGMYIGSTDEKGLHHLVWEVIDNSIDEHMAGHCDKVSTRIHTDGSISIIDNGRGIPVDRHEKLKKSALEVVMTVLHAGGKFDKDSYKVSGGLHGVGVSCVNALSSYLKAEIHRDGKVWTQEYSIGKPKEDVKVAGESDLTGTIITFKPDESIFQTLNFKYEILEARMRELAFLNAGIRMVLKDERQKNEEGETRVDEYYSDTGLKEFVEYLDDTRVKLTPEVIHIITEK